MDPARARSPYAAALGTFSLAGERQFSHKPAIAIGPPALMRAQA
jgi:hypothetical protein